MSTRHDDVVPIAALGGGEDIAGEPVLVGGIDDNLSRGVSGGDGCHERISVDSADGRGRDIRSLWSGGLYEGPAADLCVSVVVDDSTAGAGCACESDLETEFAGAALDHGDRP